MSLNGKGFIKDVCKQSSGFFATLSGVGLNFSNISRMYFLWDTRDRNQKEMYGLNVGEQGVLLFDGVGNNEMISRPRAANFYAVTAIFREETGTVLRRFEAVITGFFGDAPNLIQRVASLKLPIIDLKPRAFVRYIGKLSRPKSLYKITQKTVGTNADFQSLLIDPDDCYRSRIYSFDFPNLVTWN